MLADHYRDLHAIMNATVEELVELPDVGGIVAESIVNFLQIRLHRLQLRKCSTWV